MKKAGILIVAVFIAAAIHAEKAAPTIINDKPTTLTYPSFWHTPFGIHRGTPFWLKVFMGNRTYFNNPQDVACTKLLVDYGKINKGRDDWQLTVYGVNSGNCEIVFNSSMYSLALFGSKGSGEGELLNPTGIACNEYGDVYIADTGNHRISRWFNDGSKVRFITNIGKRGGGKGEFNRPSYLELDAKGRLFISDTGNNRIEVYSKSGGYIRSIENPALVNPQGIAVCDSAERYNGYKYDYIYVIDGDFSRLNKYTFKGELVRSVRVDTVVKKQVYLKTLDMDYYGNVYVIDYLNSAVYKFSPDLFFVDSFGKYGKEDYEFEKPAGIAIYKHYGQVFISDRESAQYFWIGSDVKNFKAVPVEDSEVRFDFFLTEKSFVSIDIETPDGTIQVCSRLSLEMGENTISWDIPGIYRGTHFRKDTAYTAVIKVMATYSSYPHILKVVKNIFFL